MEDQAIVDTRKNSVLVFHSEKVTSRSEQWKSVYGLLKAYIDVNATNCPQLLNELDKLGLSCVYHEMTYFDNVKDGLNRSCYIIDASCDMSQSHIEAAIKNSFPKVSVASVEDMEIWKKHGFTGEFILRISSTNALQDCGCEAGDVVSILREANQKGFKVTDLHFTCLVYERTPSKINSKHGIDFDLETRKRASSTLSVMKAVISDLESTNLPLLPILITGEGMPSLSQQQDQPDAEKTLAALKELSLRIPITIDGSRFFLDPSCSIYCRVTGKKHKKSGNDERFLYYLNNGVYCSFFNAHVRQEALYPKPILVVPKEGGRSDKTYDTTLFGPTCDSIDTLGNDFKLPELEEGDWLRFDGNGYRCGNYSPMFNSFEDPDVIVI